MQPLLRESKQKSESLTGRGKVGKRERTERSARNKRRESEGCQKCTRALQAACGRECPCLSIQKTAAYLLTGGGQSTDGKMNTNDAKEYLAKRQIPKLFEVRSLNLFCLTGSFARAQLNRLMAIHNTAVRSCQKIYIERNNNRLL